MNSKDFYDQNLQDSEIKKISYWDKFQNQANDKVYLIAMKRFEVQQGKNKDFCNKIDRNDLKNAVSKATSGVNTVYYISLTICFLSLFCILSCFDFILFMNSSQSENLKYVLGRMYVFSSILIVLGSLILWLTYVIVIRNQLTKSTSLMLQYADNECF